MKRIDEDYLKKCIEEAFIAYSIGNFKLGQVKEVTVDIRAAIENKVNETGME